MCDSKDIILNAIRVLRSRRVRPSDAKIAWFARREFLQSEETTADTLQELVRLGDVLKVIYKGGTSYRVAPHKVAASQKVLKPTGKKIKFTPTPTDILRPLLSAIVACDGNATKDRIGKELKESNHHSLVERLDTLLQKELRVGLIGRRIVPSPIGGRSIATYFITKSAPLALIMNKSGIINKNLPPNVKEKTAEVPKTSVSPGTPKKAPEPFEHLHQHLKRLQQEKEGVKGNDFTQTSAGSNSSLHKDHKLSPRDSKIVTPAEENENSTFDDDKPMSRRGRPRKVPTIYEDLTIFISKRGRPPKMGTTTSSRGGKQLKRARKVFDPSDGSGKKRCSIDALPGNSCPRCDVCGHISQNSFEDLLVCHRCSSRAHPNCLGYSTELAIKSRQGPWTCMDCKHCAICDMDHNIGTLIFCDECDRAYHLTCHQPPLKEQPHGTWICYACIPHSPGQTVYYDYIPGLPTPRDSPVPDDESRGSAGSWENSVVDPRIPNACYWTVDNVVSYFIEKGFGNIAGAFKEQDIDGTALLMLTRSDVLTGLDLKLGPALKIYKHVRILQTRLPNPPLP